MRSLRRYPPQKLQRKHGHPPNNLWGYKDCQGFKVSEAYYKLWRNKDGRGWVVRWVLCQVQGHNEDIMYLFLFSLFQIHYILYIGLVISLTYIVLIFGLYIYWCMLFTYLSMCCFFFFLYTHVSYSLNAIYYFCFTLRCLDEFCLKCFRNTGCQSLLVINSLLAKFLKSLC